MQAIILAAGMGKRLGELTKGNTKCMIEVNGECLIDRMLRQLSQISVSRIILVVGYQAANLKKHVGSEINGIPIVYVENPIFDKTNNIYSLAMAKEYLMEDETILLESDLIFEDSALKQIISDPNPNLALVAKYESWMDGTMVRIDTNNNVVNFVPKAAFRYSEIDSYYKTVNIYKFSKFFSINYYIPFLDAYTRAQGNNEYYEQVLRIITFLDKVDFKALPLEDCKWYEIDDIRDLNIAEALFISADKRAEKYFPRYGGYWRFPKMLDFCYLVNPYFPTPRMKEELKANFDILLTQYPSGMNINSLLAGKYFGILQKNVCVGNGAAELIRSLMGILNGRFGVVLPTFEEYPNRYRKEDVVVFTPDNPDFTYNTKDLAAYFQDKDVSTILIVNPDNPSGNFIPQAELLEFISWCAAKNIRIIIDESFVDFADGDIQTLLTNEILNSYSNLIVVKSISKSYGVPGLRLGVVASGDTTLINGIKKDISIWNINSFAEFYMQIFSKYEKEYQKACLLFKEERRRFQELLETIPFLRVVPSQANYFLCEVVSNYTSRELTECLLSHEILIKDCASKAAFGNGNYVRIAIRDSKDNDKLIETLSQL